MVVRSHASKKIRLMMLLKGTGTVAVRPTQFSCLNWYVNALPHICEAIIPLEDNLGCFRPVKVLKTPKTSKFSHGKLFCQSLVVFFFICLSDYSSSFNVTLFALSVTSAFRHTKTFRKAY